MEGGALLLLLLLLLPGGRGEPLLRDAALQVEPPGRVVAVAEGESLQLTCRLACSEPDAAVRWWGLDTSLGAMEPGARSSVLHVSAASLADAGTRVCAGSCGGRALQHSVQLQVFAFPDLLSASPATLAPGRDPEVSCTARNVTPAHPGVLSLALLLGDHELPGAEELGREEAEEAPDAVEPLFRVTQRWRLPALPAPRPAALHCRATLRLPGLERSRLLTIPVLQSWTSQEPPVTTPETSTPEAGTPEVNSLKASTPEASSLKKTSTPEATTPEATHRQGSAPSPGSPTPESRRSLCHPEIHRFPTQGGAELLCEAACDLGVVVRWTRAPGGLEAFPRREAGSRAWLSLRWAGCSPEGWFQCRLDPGGLVASLYLSPETCSHPVAADLLTGSLVLGLLLLGLVSHCLWRRCRRPR